MPCWTAPHNMKSMTMNRCKFTKCNALIALAIVLLWWSPSISATGEERLQFTANKEARQFLLKMPEEGSQQLSTLILTYDVHMDCAFKIGIQMSATLKMEQRKDYWIASFKMSEPSGENLWSSLMLTLFGKQSRTYKELLRTIEVLLVERFHQHLGRYRTESLEEFLPSGKRYENQTAIKIDFDSKKRRIKLWEDKTDPHLSKAIPYQRQLGPLTAFFNYLLFEAPTTTLQVINALKHVEQDDDTSNSKRKKVTYLLDTETLHLQGNTTGQFTDFNSALILEKGNFLDLVYGKYVFYQLTQSHTSTVKIPWMVRIEGIISKDKKNKRLRSLKKQQLTEEEIHKRLWENVDAILAARNVRAYLTGSQVVSNQ